MNLLTYGIHLCILGDTNIGLLGFTCDFMYENFLYLWVFSSYITHNSLLGIIISFILLFLFFYIPYKYISNKNKNYFFITGFLISLFFLNVKYIILVIGLDILLYFIGFIFQQYNHIKKLSNKQLDYYFMYGKFIPFFGYFYSFRIGLSNKLSIKQLFSGIIISNINLLFSFMFILGFLHQFDWFYRSEILNNEFGWQNEKLLYPEIGPFIIIYLIGTLVYLLKYKKL